MLSLRALRLGERRAPYVPGRSLDRGIIPEAVSRPPASARASDARSAEKCLLSDGALVWRGWPSRTARRFAALVNVLVEREYALRDECCTGQPRPIQHCGFCGGSGPGRAGASMRSRTGIIGPALMRATRLRKACMPAGAAPRCTGGQPGRCGCRRGRFRCARPAPPRTASGARGGFLNDSLADAADSGAAAARRGRLRIHPASCRGGRRPPLLGGHALARLRDRHLRSCCAGCPASRTR